MTEKEYFQNHFRFLPESKKKYFNQLFNQCPETVMTSTVLREVKKGYHIIEAGGECRFIYIILSGRARGIEYQNAGELYSFMEFSAGALIGDYEVFGKVKEYRVSIIAITECQLLCIPANVYAQWMKQDNSALYMRMESIMGDLTSRLSNERRFLLFHCRERLIIYLVREYEMQMNGYEKDSKFILLMTQKELSEHIGVTLRTMQRTIKQICEEGFISLKKGKIIMDKNQYLRLRQYEGEYLHD